MGLPRLRPEEEPRTRQVLRRLRRSARPRGPVLSAGRRARGHRGRGAEEGGGRSGLDLPLLPGGQPGHQHLLLRLRRPEGRREDARGRPSRRTASRRPHWWRLLQKGGSKIGKRLGIGCLGLVASSPSSSSSAVRSRRPSPSPASTGRGRSRSRSIRPVTEQAWEGEVPSGARVLGSSREVHHVDHIQTGTRTRTRTVSERVQTGTQRVKTGTRNLGNGYFEDIYENRPVYENRSHQETYQDPVYVDRPVYRQRIRYEIEKWMPDRDAKAEGRDHNAVLARSPARREGAGREARRRPYEVIFRTGKGETATWKAPNEQAWRSFEEGRAYKGKVRSNGEVTEVEGGS